jgi:hypothetical protein
MADFSNLKRRRTLGAPPSPTEASTNLDRPEVLAIEPPDSAGETPTSPSRSSEQALEGRIDGRSMRRTNRIVQFATRVTPEFDQRVRAIAMEEGLLIVEVLEKALNAYEHQRQSSR